MKKLLIGLMVAGAMALTLACGSAADEPTPPPAVRTPFEVIPGVPESAIHQVDTKYPADVVNNYMDNCMATSGGAFGYCSCVINELQERYALSQFVDFENAYLATGIMPGQVQVVMDGCN